MSKLTREQKIQICKKRKASKSLQNLSKEYRIRKGNIEYWEFLWKNEMFYGNEYTYQSLKELKVAMEEYIKYYNTQRITTKLKGLTPVQFRNQSLITA